MVFAVYENSPANGVIVVVPNDVGAFLRNLWRRDLRCEFVRFPVVATAKDVFERVFSSVACIPNSLERRCSGFVLAAIKIRFALVCVDLRSPSAQNRLFHNLALSSQQCFLSVSIIAPPQLRQ